MTAEQQREYKERAEESRESGQYGQAGRYYTLAAYEAFGACDYPDPKQITTGTHLGLGLYCLQHAATSFLAAGQQERGKNRCKQGILVVEDYLHVWSTDSPLSGLAHECIGDFRYILGEGNAAQSYETARKKYTESDHQLGWLSEPLFEWPFEFYLEIRKLAGDPIEPDSQVEFYRSFTARVDSKQQHFRKSLDRVLETESY